MDTELDSFVLRFRNDEHLGKRLMTWQSLTNFHSLDKSAITLHAKRVASRLETSSMQAGLTLPIV